MRLLTSYLISFGIVYSKVILFHMYINLHENLANIQVQSKSFVFNTCRERETETETETETEMLIIMSVCHWVFRYIFQLAMANTSECIHSNIFTKNQSKHPRIAMRGLILRFILNNRLKRSLTCI